MTHVLGVRRTEHGKSLSLTATLIAKYIADMKSIETQGELNESPVFVLSPARSGSTLLRFILDSHPDLACPPETNVALACRYLANAWSTLAKAQLDGADRERKAGKRRDALDSIRRSIDDVFSAYLKSVGKQRWCDKSPDSCWDAELLVELYPEARFICLYRHCMDMIMSAIESRPWGLQMRVGLEADSFSAHYPGNSVAAGGAYWLAHVRRILDFEERYPQLCYRVRYEDLVTRPEPIAGAIFSFLDLRQVPGIAQSCFQVPHLGDNPGDKKIWFTNKINTDSLGRGVQVPVDMLPRRLRMDINEVLGKLDYRPVNDNWNQVFIRSDPRRDHESEEVNTDSSGLQDSSELSALMRAIENRVESCSAVHERWITLLEGRILRVVVQDSGGRHQMLKWTIVSGAVRAERQSSESRQGDDGEENTVTFAADSATWRALLEGKANLDSEKKAGRLRQMGARHPRARRDEARAVAVLLGLPSASTVSSTESVS